MKYNNYSFILAATMMMVACASEPQNPADNLPAPGEQITIMATHESQPDTKTVLNEDGSVYWLPGDAIGVFFGKYNLPFYAYTDEASASALFIGEFMVVAGDNETGATGVSTQTYYSLFPYWGSGSDLIYDVDAIANQRFYWDEFDVSSFYGASRKGDEVTTYLPSLQKGVPGTFDRSLNITLAKSNDYHKFKFYNVLGGIRFKLSAEGIKKVVFKGNQEEPIAGTFTMTAGNDNIPSIKSYSNPKTEITVVLDEKAEGSFKPGEWYYIMVPPTTFAKGYTMSFYKQDGVATKTVGESVSVKRSVFGSLENPDKDLTYTPIIHAESLYLEGQYNTISLGEGETAQLTATVTPADCTFPLVWSSSDPEVVTVDQEGKITAVRAGEARVSVSCEQLTKSVYVRVYSGTTIREFYIACDGKRVDYKDMLVGDQLQLEAVFIPSSAAVPVEWSCETDEEGCISVDENGLVTALREGHATVLARAGEWVAYVSIYSYFRNGEFEIVSVDLSGADALALMPAPDSYVIDSYDDEIANCIYKIDEDGNTTPLKFTFRSDDKVLEQMLNESAWVSGVIYWMTDKYVVINNAVVYCYGYFGKNGKDYGNYLVQSGNCFVIRISDGKIGLIEDTDGDKGRTFRFDERLEYHWYTQRMRGIFRWSFDNTRLYSIGTNWEYPYYWFDLNGNTFVAQSYLDFSDSQLHIGNRAIVLDKSNNLAYLAEYSDEKSYVFFSDGGMAEIPLPEGYHYWLHENEYNWYLFVRSSYSGGSVSVYQINVNGHSVSLTNKATTAVTGSYHNMKILRNDELIVFISTEDHYTLSFNPKTDQLIYNYFYDTYPSFDSWEIYYDPFGIGYTLVDGVLTRYDLVNLQSQVINTDRSNVPVMTDTTPIYDSVNNCFFESGTRYSDTKTITVVTDCSTGKVTVYEGAYDAVFKSYLKLK